MVQLLREGPGRRERRHQWLHVSFPLFSLNFCVGGVFRVDRLGRWSVRMMNLAMNSSWLQMLYGLWESVG
jgi:hypothetical protein